VRALPPPGQTCRMATPTPVAAPTPSALRDALLGPPRAAVLLGRKLLGLALIAIFPATLFGWFGALIVPMFLGLAHTSRWLANAARRQAADWSGVRIAQSYQARPPLTRTARGWYYTGYGYDYHRYRWMARSSQHINWLGKDRATWRDIAWLALDLPVGGILAIGPLALVLGGVAGLLAPALPDLAPQWLDGARIWLLVPLGALALVAGFATAPFCLRLDAAFSALLLRPSKNAQLRTRVSQLTISRTHATQAQAAELRRIERDLHDGAQARLVSVGLTLGAAQGWLDRDPEKTRALIGDARTAAAKALAELRELVRGIHPPVLAERGLGDAIRALALDFAVPITVDAQVPGRLEDPVESAVYFCVAEALANAVKHTPPGTRVRIDLRHDHGVLRAVVSDTGPGGADIDAGTGLNGVARRLATFDGVLTVASPPGGPTEVTMEVPCESFSPRTSTSSAKV
jgi:signal transduction histidine kinase